MLSGKWLNFCESPPLQKWKFWILVEFFTEKKKFFATEDLGLNIDMNQKEFHFLNILDYRDFDVNVKMIDVSKKSPSTNVKLWVQAFIKDIKPLVKDDCECENHYKSKQTADCNDYQDFNSTMKKKDIWDYSFSKSKNRFNNCFIEENKPVIAEKLAFKFWAESKLTAVCVLRTIKIPIQCSKMVVSELKSSAQTENFVLHLSRWNLVGRFDDVNCHFSLD